MDLKNHTERLYSSLNHIHVSKAYITSVRVKILLNL